MAVGTAVAGGPPRRSQRARLTHWAPALGDGDESLLGPVLGHLMAVVVPRGAFALWVAGAADRAIVTSLQAGFRMDQFPVLLCWDRPFATFSHYLPISPGLL